MESSISVDDSTLPRFSFGLDALIRMRQWESDALKVEIGRFSMIAAELQSDARNLEGKIAEIRRDIAEQSARESIIVLERREISRQFLIYQNELLLDKQHQLERTIETRDRIVAQLSAKNAELRGLERKREARRLEYESEQRQKTQREADELWLLKVARGR